VGVANPPPGRKRGSRGALTQDDARPGRLQIVSVACRSVAGPAGPRRAAGKDGRLGDPQLTSASGKKSLGPGDLLTLHPPGRHLELNQRQTNQQP
jgi:hypothetical protein